MDDIKTVLSFRLMCICSFFTVKTTSFPVSNKTKGKTCALLQITIIQNISDVIDAVQYAQLALFRSLSAGGMVIEIQTLGQRF